MPETISLIFHARKNFETREAAEAYYRTIKMLLASEDGLCISANINSYMPQEVIGNEGPTPNP